MYLRVERRKKRSFGVWLADNFQLYLWPQNSEAREPVGFTGRSTGGDCRVKERPTPEGAGGSRGSANMCQRTEDTPSSRCLQVGERFRMPFSGGTLRRAHPGGGQLGGSDRKVAGCDKCSATLVGLKKQALSLAVHHRFSCKVSDAPMDDEEEEEEGGHSTKKYVFEILIFVQYTKNLREISIKKLAFLF